MSETQAVGLGDVPLCLRRLARAALAAAPADSMDVVLAAAGYSRAPFFKYACLNAVLAVLAPDKALGGMDARRRVTELSRGRVYNYTKKRWPLTMVALMAGVQAATIVQIVARVFRANSPSAVDARRFLNEVGQLAEEMLPA